MNEGEKKLQERNESSTTRAPYERPQVTKKRSVARVTFFAQKIHKNPKKINKNRKIQIYL